MSVATSESTPSNQQATHEIPKQNSLESFTRPILKLIHAQPEAPMIENIPTRRALDGQELEKVREMLQAKQDVTGRDVLRVILGQLDILPTPDDTARLEEREAILAKMNQAEDVYRKTFFRETTNGAEVLNFNRFQELLDDTEEFEGDPLFVSITRIANISGMQNILKSVLEADRLARIIYRDIKQGSTNDA